MSETFVVGQWVVSEERVGVFRIAELHHGGTLKVDVAGGGWSPQEIWKPFVWQLATYRTTIDGVTATVDRVSCDRVWVACKWHRAGDPIYARNFHQSTGKLCGFEDRDDVPHLLPYLADEPPPVAEAATFSEFAEADECDDVNHPTHYTSHPSGVECITITEAFNFNIGNAIKYLWRAGLKGDALEDLRKATWYVQREIERAKR